MWSYVQMWFPLLTIVLTAAICLSVVSFIVRQPKVHR
jgi:hypothetical protein